MKNKHFTFVLILMITVLIAGCNPQTRMGRLQSEHHEAELGIAEPASVEINMGAGDLEVSGGAQKLMEADLMYKVEVLRPEVRFSNGIISIQQPDTEGLPNLENIAGFRNEWEVRLNDEVPMDVSVDMGAGTGNLDLDDLSLTGLNLDLGAGTYTIDLSGNWTRDLEATIDAGAALLRVILPGNIGTRVRIESGAYAVEAAGLTKDGDVYTNAAYGVSDVTLQVVVEAGIAKIILEVEQAAITPGITLQTP